MNDTYFEQTRLEIRDLIPDRIGIVMELGCGAGNTLEWLKKEFRATRTIGVEINDQIASQARERVDAVYCLDITRDLSELNQYEGKVDLLLLLDVLEHLPFPWETLIELKRLLSPGAVVVASIPNVRSIKVLLPLIFLGRWDYAGAGILDRTHLRFFTRKTAAFMFENAGFAVEAVIANGPVKFSQAKSRSGKLAALLNFVCLSRFDDFIANQFLIRARLP